MAGELPDQGTTEGVSSATLSSDETAQDSADSSLNTQIAAANAQLPTVSDDGPSLQDYTVTWQVGGQSFTVLVSEASYAMAVPVAQQLVISAINSTQPTVVAV